MLNKKLNKKISGFTLVELLVVISIIGFISTVAVAQLVKARERSRDTRRLADIAALKKALNIYYDTNGYYPPVQQACSINSCTVAPGATANTYSTCSTSAAATWSLLINSSILAKMPSDPTLNTGYCYTYDAEGVTATTPKPQAYRLTVKLENSSLGSSDGGSYTALYEQGEKLTTPHWD